MTHEYKGMAIGGPAAGTWFTKNVPSFSALEPLTEADAWYNNPDMPVSDTIDTGTFEYAHTFIVLGMNKDDESELGLWVNKDLLTVEGRLTDAGLREVFQIVLAGYGQHCSKERKGSA